MAQPLPSDRERPEGTVACAETRRIIARIHRFIRLRARP
jgi:hypothetical protein